MVDGVCEMDGWMDRKGKEGIRKGCEREGKGKMEKRGRGGRVGGGNMVSCSFYLCTLLYVFTAAGNHNNTCKFFHNSATLTKGCDYMK